MISKEFKTSIQKALADENLGGALGRFAEAYVLSRASAYADAGLDFEEIREEIVALKDYLADHLEELAERFTLEAERRGARVLRTSSVEEVKKYIGDLAQKHQVKTIVKAKSMASEEIYLNKYLESQGLRVRETDLGEWIIQLAGQSPSHMVMPAIHLTKEEVADILGQEVQEKLASDIPRLVKVARRELRPDFLSAGIGITGANLAVAESGTLVIITNEGNARLASSMPPIHVALVGLEKLVASLEDVPKVLKALPRSATAQQLTSYVSFITGPVPAMVDGQVQPKELHIILMDNKRIEMRDDPQFKEALRCIRCASCLNVCPVYRLVGGHVFGHIYAGGIGTILTAFFNTKEDAKEIQALCLQCGLCKEFCPTKIDIPALILELRTRLVKEKGLPFVEKAIFEAVLSNRQLFHRLLRTASKFQKPWTGQSTMIRHLPLFFAGHTEKRSLPAIATKPLRDRVPARGMPGKKEQASKRRVAFYGGCLIDFVYPQVGEAVIKVLKHYGVEVHFPPGQTCCGAPAKFSGATDGARKMARQNIEAFSPEDYEAVISACPTCTIALKEDFSRLMA
ncbi:MAG TPA: LUD domain-containing protein, partial [Clostridia bacterium]|nr:LUD domain-containing protein [Clostridia bacterium]